MINEGRGAGMTSARATEAVGDVSLPEVQAVGQSELSSPLTERILGQVGPRRRLWIAVWASSAILILLVMLAVLAVLGESDRVRSVSSLVISQAALAYAVGLALWGVGRLNREARALEPLLIRLTHLEHPRYPVAGIVAGPILLSVAISVVVTLGWWVRYGPVPAVAVLPLLIISLVPIMTFVWSYLQLLVGLDRLGRARLHLDLFPQDRSLGLSPVGSLAFTGWVILFAGAIPIFVTTSANLASVALGLVLVGASTAMFFLSMWRIHGQMAAGKAAYVAAARALYAEAYAPLRATPTVETLASQATALGAAHALVERAERILLWPVDERMTAWVAIIVTGVVTSMVVRLIVVAAGV